MRSRFVVGLLLLALPSLGGRRVSADDYHLESDTRFEVFEVNVPASPVVYRRRRLVQTLAFGWARAVGEPDEPRFRLIGQLRLRLDRDFGRTCQREGRCLDLVDPADPTEYLPIAFQGRLDVPEARVGVLGLPGGTGVEAGRMVQTGTIGMVRLDGLRVRHRPRPWLSIQTYGGAQVRTASIGGSFGFSPLGSLRIELPEEVIPGQAEYVAPPSRTYLVGVDVETSLPSWLRGRLSFRESFDEDGVVLRRVGWGASSDLLERLHMQVDGVLDLRDGSLIDVVGIVAHRLPRVRLEAAVERHEPRFDPGTIWGWFDLVPVAHARLRAVGRIGERYRLGGGIRGRRADFGAEGDEEDIGAEIDATAALGRTRLALSAFGWIGDLGPVGSLRLDATHRIGAFLRFYGQASAFRFENELREGYEGVSVHWALGMAYAITPEAEASARFEHAHNSIVGHRFRGLFTISLEMWR